MEPPAQAEPLDEMPIPTLEFRRAFIQLTSGHPDAIGSEGGVGLRDGIVDVAAGPLPGQTLVVLEPEYQLATDVFCCEDGHAQDRSLLDRVLARVQAKDLWLADRNFCTTGFLFGLARRRAAFLIRQHGSTLQWQRESKPRRMFHFIP